VTTITGRGGPRIRSHEFPAVSVTTITDRRGFSENAAGLAGSFCSCNMSLKEIAMPRMTPAALMKKVKNGKGLRAIAPGDPISITIKPPSIDRQRKTLTASYELKIVTQGKVIATVGADISYGSRPRTAMKCRSAVWIDEKDNCTHHVGDIVDCALPSARTLIGEVTVVAVVQVDGVYVPFFEKRTFRN
jgi:hypothetical protein